MSENQPKQRTEQWAKKALIHALQLEEKDLLQEALAECGKVIASFPDNADAHNLKGILLEQMGLPDEALESYQEAILINPDFLEARMNLDDLQAEIQDNFLKANRGIALQTALLSALVLGMIFSLVGMLIYALQVKSQPTLATIFPILWILREGAIYALAGGILSLVLAQIVECSLLFSGLITAIGFGLSYTLSHPVMRLLEAPIIAIWPDFRFYSIVNSLVVGIGIGVTFSVAFKHSKRRRQFIVVGITSSVLSKFFSSWLFSSSAYFSLIYKTTGIPINGASNSALVYLAVPGFLEGVIVGAMFGWLIGLYQPYDLEESFSEEMPVGGAEPF